MGTRAFPQIGASIMKLLLFMFLVLGGCASVDHGGLARDVQAAGDAGRAACAAQDPGYPVDMLDHALARGAWYTGHHGAEAHLDLRHWLAALGPEVAAIADRWALAPRVRVRQDWPVGRIAREAYAGCISSRLAAVEAGR